MRPAVTKHRPSPDYDHNWWQAFKWRLAIRLTGGEFECLVLRPLQLGDHATVKLGTLMSTAEPTLAKILDDLTDEWHDGGFPAATLEQVIRQHTGWGSKMYEQWVLTGRTR